LDSVERLQKGVVLGSMVIATLVLLAGGLAIRSALEGALQPVAQMTESIDDWSAHDLDKRFDLGPPRDELTHLAATLDGLLARIAASRRHEQRFASEVAHELRTPLTRLRLRAELALSTDPAEAPDEREQALQSVVEQSARLDSAIEALLAVARHDFDPTQGTVDLAAVAREIDGVEVEAPANLPLAEGDADVVGRAIAPLVDNARRYARERVWLTLSSAHGRVLLAVHDDGPGLDPSLGERAFDPGVRGGDDEDGVGLGLPLARRLARSCGGDIKLGEGPGGHFVLDLPALVRRADAASPALD
jgi:signal transduction histidine kinase